MTTPLDPEARDYLRALRDLLAKAPRSSWPVLFAHASLDDVLDADGLRGRVDWDHETEFLRARLAEVERAQATATESAGERKP
jgi:glyoxylase-like metal-dependent hydrolase (beta-lactamase superfamily II)